jgi:hypothetical protein
MTNMIQQATSLSEQTSQSAQASVPCLNEVVWEVANDIQAPWPLVLNTTLAVMTTATQSLIDVVTPLGHVKPVSNFFVGIAESGNRKSAVDKALTKAVKAFENDQQKNFEETTLPAYQTDLEVWKTEVSRLKRKATDPKATEDEAQMASNALASHLQRQPSKPRQPQLLYRDFTGAALMEGLAEKSRCAFVSSSDASGVLHGHAFRNLADLNLLWDGDTHLVNRAGREALRILDSRLTIDIAVQMGPYRDFLLKGDKARDTGFAARCLTCLPQSLMGSRFTQIDKRTDQSHLKLFHKRVFDLLELARSKEDTDGHIQRQQVTFSYQAGLQWAGWINNTIEPELNVNGQWRTVADQASKIPEIVARLAAVLTYFESGDLEITLPTFYRARDIGMTYLQSYRDICNGQVEHMKRDQIKSILENWIQQRFMSMHNHNMVTGQRNLIFVEKNKIRTYGPNQVRSKKALDETLGMLQDERKICVGPLRMFTDPRFSIEGGDRIVVTPGSFTPQ